MPESLDLSAPSSQKKPSQPAEESTDSLVLTPPEPVPVIEQQNTGLMMALPPERVAELSALAERFVSNVKDSDPLAPDFQKTVDEVVKMGNREIEATVSSSSRMLDRPVAAIKSAKGEGEAKKGQQKVANDLAELRVTIEELDPSKVETGVLSAIKKMLPFRSEIKSYFAQYESSQAQLDSIIRSLKNGQDELRKDNASIDGEKANLWNVMEKLQEYAVLAQAMDAELEEHIARVEQDDAQRADTLKSDLLFAVRQKHQDLLTQLAVSAQAYLALDVIRRNNVELIRGVERATATTVTALRTAVIVAQALANQKLVLDQINALNATTSSLILNTSKMLGDQSRAIQQQADAPSVSMDTLNKAFQNVYGTIDAIDSYRVLALDSMATTVNNLETQIGIAKEYVDRAKDRSSRYNSDI